MDFIIDRSIWRCGGEGKYAKGKGETVALLNREGSMCCLGQTLSQCGIEDKILLDKGEPYEVAYKTYKNTIFYKRDEAICNTYLSDTAMGINDAEDINTKQRERILKQLFKDNGHNIKFLGKSVKYKK